MSKQPELFEDFRTAEEGHTVFCHQDFLQKIEENRKSAVGKRAALLLERLIVDPRREFYKSTLGVNQGWRRSRLGGHGGSHFYAWWAPKGAPPLRGLDEFEALPDGALFLRDIRHHDDHSELRPQSFSDNYLPLAAREIRGEEYSPSPLTPTQAQFTASRQKIRIIKGYPGSGKTTALWHAADANSRESTLYVTYSKDLAALARTHFQRFAPAHKQFHVLTFSRLVRELSGVEAPDAAEAEGRERFLKELGSIPPRLLGAWMDDRKALYDEIHANMVGAALPLPIGRFAACQQPRVPPRIYREQRRRYIGGAAADVVLEVVDTLSRRHADFFECFFPQLLLAWKAVERLRQPQQGGISRSLLNFDCLAIDEAQDLTPIEVLVLTRLAAAARDRARGALTVLIAGDEAQTVRATDFDWGWFHDILHQEAGPPQEFKLATNLRSPRRIARLINSVWSLYSTLGKQDRPGGWREAEIEDEASDQLLYCSASPGPEVEQLLRTFADREGLAIISLTDAAPGWMPPDLRPRILTVSEAKGLDFQSVCILDASERLQKIVAGQDRVRRDTNVEPLSRRLAIDQLRVAVSRPTERIYFLDVAPPEHAREQLLSFLRWADDGNDISPAIPATVLKTLEEELLEPEERVRLCEADARQYLEVKPEMAWVRAKQAVSLLGPPGEKRSVSDAPVRQSAHLTLAQVAYCLGLRDVRLSRELGDPDFFEEASDNARRAGRPVLAEAILDAEVLHDDFMVGTMIELMRRMERNANQFDPWFAAELSTRAPQLLRKLEENLEILVQTEEILSVLPGAYKVYGVVDGAGRLGRFRRQAIEKMMGRGLFPLALPLIEQEPDASPALRAECLEGMDKFAEAAEIFRGLNRPKDALRNYRSIPEVEKALGLMREMGAETAAAESLEWLLDLRRLLERRPANLARTITAAEKKYLAALLEAQLDGPRAKKAVKPRVPRRQTPAKPARKRT